jgi:voltage-gated potassium channel
VPRRGHRLRSRLEAGSAVNDQIAVNDLGAALPGDARRMIARSVLRILASTVTLLLLYAFVPVPESTGARVLVGLMAGLVIFVALVGRQIVTILRAEHPVLRAIEVLALALPLLAVVFAFTYLSLSRADAASFSEELDRVGAMYFTVSTISTVGFGDLAPRSETAQILVTVQMLFDLALIAGLVRLVILATRTGVRRQSAGGDAA